MRSIQIALIARYAALRGDRIQRLSHTIEPARGLGSWPEYFRRPAFTWIKSGAAFGSGAKSRRPPSTRSADRPRAPPPRAPHRKERRRRGDAAARPTRGRRTPSAAAGRETESAPRSARRQATTHKPDKSARWAKPSHNTVAAASLASPPPIQPRLKKTKTTASTRAAAAACDNASAALMPVMAASTAKPATRISETRLAIVIVNRSLEAANAITAGNNVNLIASVSMSMAMPQGRWSSMGFTPPQVESGLAPSARKRRKSERAPAAAGALS